MDVEEDVGVAGFRWNSKINSLSLTCSSVKANGFIIAQRTLNCNPEGCSRNTYSSYSISSSFRAVASWSERKKSHKTLQTLFMHCTQWRSKLCSLNCIYLHSKLIWREKWQCLFRTLFLPSSLDIFSCKNIFFCNFEIELEEEFRNSFLQRPSLSFQ